MLISTKFIGNLFSLFAALFCCVSMNAQSTEQNRPTPVTSNEIAGIIAPRPIGDSRLTTYYFVFSGTQGDTFVNVKTNNFSGDIDVFYADTLLPIAKIVLFADLGESETGRVLYLRKSENLMLRLQGRSPNDDQATYQIKFAGSFVPSTAKFDDTPLPSVPVTVKPVETVAKTEKAEIVEAAEDVKVQPETKLEVKVTSKLEPNVSAAERRKRNEDIRKQRVADANAKRQADAENKAAAVAEKKEKATVNRASTKKAKVEEETAVNPLASIFLLVELKNGDVFKKPMTEVLRFNVDKGILTIITNDGKVIRHNLVDVAKTSIE